MISAKRSAMVSIVWPGSAMPTLREMKHRCTSPPTESRHSPVTGQASCAKKATAGEDSSGVSGFFQFGANRSATLPANQSFGMGLTGFGLVPGRLKDSMGAGMSWAWLNPNLFHRSSELMFQTYYQANVWKSVYLEPAISYIPTPGASSSLGGAWASTIQVTVLF